MDDSFLEEIAQDLDLDRESPVALDEEKEKYQGVKKVASHNEEAKAGQKPTLNAARLRKHRQKKKKERDQMYKDNKVLKREREEFLKKIADLQMEVEALRTQGCVDLSKENELLKAEIKKHRAYIDRVVDVALNTPNNAEDIERTRILRNALDSGSGHVMGLAYASANSDLWKKAKSFSLSVSDDITVEEVQLWYQYLPIGAPDEDVKRINLRFEIDHIPLDFEALAEAHWKLNSREELIQEQLKGCPHTGHLNLEVLLPKTKLSEEEEIVCMCLKNVNQRGVQNLFVSNYKKAKMYPMAFPKPSKTDAEATTENVSLVYNSACGPIPQAKSSEVEIVQDENLDGYIYRRSPEGGTGITIIQSMPLSGALFELAIEGVLQQNRHINENETLHPMIIAVQEQRLRSALRLYERE